VIPLGILVKAFADDAFALDEDTPDSRVWRRKSYGFASQIKG
jgi:hypothetical protein